MFFYKFLPGQRAHLVYGLQVYFENLNIWMDYAAEKNVSELSTFDKDV